MVASSCSQTVPSMSPVILTPPVPPPSYSHQPQQLNQAPLSAASQHPCRCLFGRPDRTETVAYLTAVIRRQQADACRRWDFDFATGRPAVVDAARYEWTPTGPSPSPASTLTPSKRLPLAHLDNSPPSTKTSSTPFVDVDHDHGAPMSIEPASVDKADDVICCRLLPVAGGDENDSRLSPAPTTRRRLDFDDVIKRAPVKKSRKRKSIRSAATLSHSILGWFVLSFLYMNLFWAW